MKNCRSQEGEGAIITLIFLGLFSWAIIFVLNFMAERTSALRKMARVQNKVHQIHSQGTARQKSFEIPYGRLPNKKTKLYPVYMDFGE